METMGFILAESDNKPSSSALKEVSRLTYKVYRLVIENKHIYNFAPPKTDIFIAELKSLTNSQVSELRKKRTEATSSS